jgi:maltose O-acetyltransferase
VGVTRYAEGKKPIVGKGANLGEDTILDCHGQITIGAETFFGHRVMVLTGSHNYFRFGSERKNHSTSRPVTIGAGVWVCSGAIICPGVTIGDHAVIGPGSVVYRNVPAYGVVAGNPARLVRRLNRGR